MLILSVKPGEKVHIGQAVVTVTRIQGGRVKLGIQAPRETQIDRGVVRQRKERAA